jgi:histidine ammonia-lyase
MNKPAPLSKLVINGSSLHPEVVSEVALNPDIQVELGTEAAHACQRSRQAIENILTSGKAIYGVNTGFGDLANVRISDGDLHTLQENLIRSHACGVGHALTEAVVRGTLLLRANALAKGASGVGPHLVQGLLDLLNHGVVPWIPEHGSLGASGDLAPLAHMALVLMGEGEAFYQGRRMPGGEALEAAGLIPLRLGAKEGLALTNGTSVMTSLGCLSVTRSRRLLITAAATGAMSVEALRGSDIPFRHQLAALRGHPGHIEAASILRSLIDGSEIREDHRDCAKVQDPYSMRCFPQVLGAGIDALHWIHSVLAIECNAATDNPLVVDGEALSGGNFHGAPLGYPLDLLAILLTDLSSMAERRTFRLLTTFLSDLPPFLTKQGGLNSGMMIPQYTQASLVAECKIRSGPASIDSIPSSADQEDHVSMATHAARKSRAVLGMAENVVAIELMTACQGLEFHLPLKPGKALQEVYGLVRTRVAPLEQDRQMAGDIEAIRQLIAEGEIARIVEPYLPEESWLRA